VNRCAALDAPRAMIDLETCPEPSSRPTEQARWWGV